jgi:YidC/Oxa1 family membrane protein insertase
MEQVRILIAIVLSLLVFVVYEMVFVKREPLEKQQTVQTQKEAETKEKTTVSKSDLPEPTENTKESQNKTVKFPESEDINGPKREINTVTIHTPLYIVTISENGAKITSFLLKNYKESVGEDAALKEMVPKEFIDGTIMQEFKQKSVPGFENAVFSTRLDGNTIDVYNLPKTITFYWTSANGIEIEKEYHFSPNTYLIGLQYNIKNRSTKNFEDALSVQLKQFIDVDKTMYGFEGASGLISGNMERIKSDDIEGNINVSGDIKWVAIETQYFLTSIVAEKPRSAQMRVELIQEKVVKNSYMENNRNFVLGDQSTYQYNIYLGPKSMKVLNDMNNELDRTVDFGIFDFLAKPFLWCMNFIYDYIPNYGVAIIILTIIIKILLWPLGNKSYKSMAEMKKLQPLVNDLREKYKDDKKKLNQEMMALYKTYKVNPMGGCLPMILQIPVFIAFYRMLYEAIELRHAPFFGWINDLSAPDRLFRFDFAIPLMQPPYGIPVLTLIMGATMFVQQKMSPPPGDPSQAKIMMFMPLIFTVIFVNFSSGLVLYWLVNNILSIGQQYYVQKKKA